jgi:hypothetical protein
MLDVEDMLNSDPELRPDEKCKKKLKFFVSNMWCGN